MLEALERVVTLRHAPLAPSIPQYEAWSFPEPDVRSHILKSPVLEQHQPATPRFPLVALLCIVEGKRVSYKSTCPTSVPFEARVLQEECLEDSQPYAHPCTDTPAALRRL